MLNTIFLYLQSISKEKKTHYFQYIIGLNSEPLQQVSLRYNLVQWGTKPACLLISGLELLQIIANYREHCPTLVQPFNFIGAFVFPQQALVPVSARPRCLYLLGLVACICQAQVPVSAMPRCLYLLELGACICQTQLPLSARPWCLYLLGLGACICQAQLLVSARQSYLYLLGLVACICQAQVQWGTKLYNSLPANIRTRTIANYSKLQRTLPNTCPTF